MDEEAGADAGVRQHGGMETDETAEETARASVGSGVENGMLGRGFAMLRSVFRTIVSGVGGAIGRIATAPVGGVAKTDESCPVRKNSSRLSW